MATATGVDRTGSVRRLARAVAVALGLGLPAAAIAWAVRAEVTALVEADVAVVRAATDLTRDAPGLRRGLLVGAEVFQARWVNLAGLGLAAWVWLRFDLRRRVVWAVVTVLVAWGLGNLLKEVVRRARPVVDEAVAHAPGYSFPSGHSLNTAAAAITLTILVWPLLGPRGRAVVAAVATVAVVGTAADRVLLGVHYLSDVVAGVLLGAGVALGSYRGYAGGADERRGGSPA